MGDERTTERIAAWQAAGLIDAATAERLAAYEEAATIAPAARAPRPAFASLLGPPASIRR